MENTFISQYITTRDPGQYHGVYFGRLMSGLSFNTLGYVARVSETFRVIVLKSSGNMRSKIMST